MKQKSMKLRFLVTLHALLKYSDEDHRLNGVKLNEYLRPYGLDCSSRVLNDTVAVLRDFGLDVRNKGVWDNQGVWIEDRPLPDETLKQLIFAVSTNPYIPQEQAQAILGSLSPFVTVYQEPMLKCGVETADDDWAGAHIIDAYNVIQKAIHENRRVLYTVTNVRYNKETGEVYEEDEWETLFTPKCVYQTKESIYMVGYNHPDRKVEAVDIRSVTGVRMAFKHNYAEKDNIRKKLSKINPAEYIPETRRQVIYKGPAVIRCRGQYLPEVVRMFGSPSEPVKKDARCRSTVIYSDAEITSETIFRIAEVPGRGIRLKGPGGLTEAVRAYFEGAANELLDARLVANNLC